VRKGGDLGLLSLWALTTVLMGLGIGLVFLQAPEERVMGAVQKVFYFHVPAAFAAYACVLVLLGGSMAYLWTRNLVFDDLARAATEVGLLFSSVVLITGPIWAKPAWGVWWTWEARLLTTLILWLLLAGCLMVRSYADNRELGARLASVVGIVAAVDVPIIHKAVDWWRGQHPVVFAPGKRGALAPSMQPAFWLCTLVFLLLCGLLLALRYRLARLEGHVEALALGEGEAV
jgi:heme exporter protein C